MGKKMTHVSNISLSGKWPKKVGLNNNAVKTQVHWIKDRAKFLKLHNTCTDLYQWTVEYLVILRGP